jgi:hypothetical protein
VPVTIAFSLPAGTAIATITKFPHDRRTFGSTLRSAHIYVFGPSIELSDITHTDETVPTLSIRIAITILVFARTAERTKIVVAFGYRAVLAPIGIDNSQTDIGIG